MTTDSIRSTLNAYIVGLSPSKRPNLQIETPEEVFFLVRVLEPVLAQTDGDTLTFISFEGMDPMGRKRTFMWPEGGVEAPALPITGVVPYAS